MDVKKCYCGSITQVIDTRERLDGSIHRRRQCPRCKERFSTVEISSAAMKTLKQKAKHFDSIKLKVRGVMPLNL